MISGVIAIVMLCEPLAALLKPLSINNHSVHKRGTEGKLEDMENRMEGVMERNDR